MILGFDNRELLPAIWRDAAGADAVRVFNPALLRDSHGWLLAYRVVVEPDSKRRIAICRLTPELKTIEGTQVPLTDWIRFPTSADIVPQGTSWFADPRLYQLGGRLFIYWNSGWHEPRNHQFLQELDAVSLRPMGVPRELILAGTRQKLEKNWGLFEHDGHVHAIYSVNPHRALRVSLAGEGPVECTELAPPRPNPGGYAQLHGGLRGGAPPQRVGDYFYSFCHSIENDPLGFRYVPAVYRFAPAIPFAPTDMPCTPLKIEVPLELRRKLPKLNPAVGEVLYPAGAAYADGSWLLSLGVDDERCAIAKIDHGEVLKTLERVG